MINEKCSPAEKWRPRVIERVVFKLKTLESEIITSNDNFSLMRAMWLPNTFIYQTTTMRIDKITSKLTFSGNLMRIDGSFCGKLLDGPKAARCTALHLRSKVAPYGLVQ